jgi:hypothetical protein
VAPGSEVLPARCRGDKSKDVQTSVKLRRRRVRQRAVVGRKAGDSEEASTSQTGRRWLRRAAFSPAVNLNVALLSDSNDTRLDP